jgi:CO/xanthine dehydrogenase Mo-binding subunit
MYVDDVPFEDVRYGVTVRAPLARGRIRAIRFDPAFPWAECIVITARDLPGPNLIPGLADDQPCLAADEIHHAGQPVVLLAHRDRYMAERARQSVTIDCEPLPAVLDPEASAECFKTILIEKGDLAAGFAGASHVVEGVYTTAAQEHAYLETQGMAARVEGGTVLVWGSMQCPYYVHRAVEQVLAPLQARVIQLETGGGFGGKEEYPSVIAVHTALLAARAGGATVKMVYSRAEDMAATTKRHPSRVRHRTAVDPAGRLLAMEIDVLLDAGAFTTISPVVLSRAAIHAAGPYFCENIRIRARAVRTNHPPHGAFRGFGAPQTQFAMERQMDEIGRATGAGPVEVRRRNFLRQGQTTATGQVLREPMDLAALLDEALARSGYGACPGPDTRMGIAAVLHGTGFTGTGERDLHSSVRLERTAAGVRIVTAATEIGQGSHTVLPQIVAAEMGIPLEHVEMAPPDTAIAPDSGPTVASRTTMIAGGLLAEAARQLRSSNAASATVHYTPSAGSSFDEATYTGDAYPGFAWAVNVATITLDRQTGEARVLDLVAVQDAGRIVNPVLAAGQVAGGAAQAIGLALYEEVLYENGRVANGALSRYIVPGPVDLPPVRVYFQEATARPRGLGELPMNGPAAAIGNALTELLGAPANRLPMTPERILACLPTP